MTELFVILGAAGRVQFITTRRCERERGGRGEGTDNALRRNDASREGSVRCGLGGGRSPPCTVLQRSQPTRGDVLFLLNNVPLVSNLECGLTAVLKGKPLSSANKDPCIMLINDKRLYMDL